MGIKDNYLRLREDIPNHVRIVAACKTRTFREVKELIEAGAAEIGYNYVQEALTMRTELGMEADTVTWHMIGHLQRNKVNHAVSCFTVIQTVDSLRLAETIDTHVKNAGKVVPVYIEINSGREPQKSGVMPEKAEELIERLSSLTNITIEGLMTMGPQVNDPEELRPYFRETKELFDRVRSSMSHLNIHVLSMGMSSDYRVAIEEGSTMVRLGTDIFGKIYT